MPLALPTLLAGDDTVLQDAAIESEMAVGHCLRAWAVVDQTSHGIGLAAFKVS